MVWYGMVWYGMVWYGIVRYGRAWCLMWLGQVSSQNLAVVGFGGGVSGSGTCVGFLFWLLLYIVYLFAYSFACSYARMCYNKI